MTNMNNHRKRKQRAANPAWPFRSHNSSPIEWWRLLPRENFRDAEKLVLNVSLERVTILHANPKLKSALAGSTEAALSAALAVLPFDEITLEIDLIMSSVLRCALNGSPAAALVLESVLDSTRLRHDYAAELSESWCADPAWGTSFPPALPSVEETALSEAVYEYFSTKDGRASA